MTHRPVAVPQPVAGTGPNRAGYVLLCLPGGGFDIGTFSQKSCNCRRQRTAGAVVVAGLDPIAFELQHSILICQVQQVRTVSAISVAAF